MKNICIILFSFFLSCKPSTTREIHQVENYHFAILDNEPVFEDEYLFEKEKKSCLIENVEGVLIYYCDWNSNGNHKEIGVDYIGIKSKLEQKPTLIKLEKNTPVNINGEMQNFYLEENTLRSSEKKLDLVTNLNITTKLHPILLESNEYFLPKIHSDSTVIYFWATWCRPCVETLKNIDLEKLEKKNISFIPIAYNCSGTKDFFNQNSLNFSDLNISEQAAKDYNILSLPTQYTFLKNGEISDNNVKLKTYFSNSNIEH